MEAVDIFIYGEKHRNRECLKQNASDNCTHGFQRNQAAGKGPRGTGRCVGAQREEQRASRAATAQVRPVHATTLHTSRQRILLAIFVPNHPSAASISCVAAPVELEVLFPKRPFFYTSKVLTPI